MDAGRIVIRAAVALSVAAVAALIVVKVRHASVTLTGVLLRQDPDPKKQLPIPNAKVIATEGDRAVEGKSEASGLFRLKLPNGGWREQPVELTFRHPDYESTTFAPRLDGELFIVRMKPIPSQTGTGAAPEIPIKDVRVRYAEKTLSTVDVGSTAKTFTVPNIGNVACGGKAPCSPDGRWKAAVGAITIDAGEGQQLTNTRVSCIAGPCPFTKVETGAVVEPGRTAVVRVRNWSDTATFLVEAEVTRNMPSDAARRAYPAIYGRAMSFTLPAGAEGPSIEADLGGAEIVFPLGPALRLSWAECTLQVGADKTKLYRCELKPGYRFQ
jgi:hypothetical protein